MHEQGSDACKLWTHFNRLMESYSMPRKNHHNKKKNQSNKAANA
jgi:hypothetical protein